MAVAHHMFELAVVLALLALCAAVGLFAMRRLRAGARGRVEQLVFAVALGGGLLGTGLLGLGWAGELRPLPMLLLFAALAVVTRKDLAHLPADVAAAVREVRSLRAGRVAGWVAVVGFAAAAAVLLLAALAPVTDWDSLMYHVRIPAQYLARGEIYLPEDNLHATRVGLAHLLYVPLLAVGAEAGPALLSAAFALLLGLAAFAFGNRFLDGGVTAALSLGLLWGTGSVLLVASTPRVDVTLAFYLFMAQYAAVAALEGERPSRQLLLAGALLGLAFGVKYHGALYGVCLAPLAAWTAWARNGTGRAHLGALAAFALAGALVSLPWLVKNWLLLRAPLYPFLADPVVQPWLAALQGSSGLPPGAGSGALDFLWELRRPFNLRDFFLAPGRLAIEREARLYLPNPLLLAAPLALLAPKRRVVAWLVLPAVAYFVVGTALFPHVNLRYLIPALVPLTVAGVYAVAEGARRLPVRWRAAVVAPVSALALWPAARAAAFRVEEAPVLAYAAGALPEDGFLARHRGLEVRPYLAMRTLLSQVPETARVLLLFDARGHGTRRRVLQDNDGTNWPFLAAGPGPKRCLANAGITHVIVNEGALRYYLDAGPGPESVSWSAFQRFARRCLREDGRAVGIVLYRVRRPESRSPVP
ncbi:MAG: hypothetical protein ACE5HP_02475 [Gemmatimonadota bacterium]